MKFEDVKETWCEGACEIVYDGIRRVDVNPFLCKHHTAYCRGYVRVNQMVMRPYNGRFGKGYCVLRHNPGSTRYCFITYYTDKDGATL